MSDKLQALHGAIAKAKLSPRQTETVRDLMIGFCQADVPPEKWARYVEESVAFAAKTKPGYDPHVSANSAVYCGHCGSDVGGRAVICQDCIREILIPPARPEPSTMLSGKDAAAGPDL